MKYDDTLCWKCAKSANSNLCCWAGGVPRTDWVATPTVIQNQKLLPAYSFFVHKCDGFVLDPRYKTEGA